MQPYAKDVENLPNPISCTPNYAGFYFGNHRVRITTCRDNAGQYFELKDLTEAQIKIVADFGGMLAELGGLGTGYEDMITENVAELREASDVPPV